MSRRSEHVYTDPEDIAWLEALALRLPSNAHVAVQCKDGSQCTGVVSQRPSPQMFYDAEGVEGVNAVLRLEDDQARDGERELWLDRIASVRKLDSISECFED